MQRIRFTLEYPSLSNCLTFGFIRSAPLLVIAFDDHLAHALHPTVVMLTLAFEITLMRMLAPLVKLLCHISSTRLVTTAGSLLAVSTLVVASFTLSRATLLPLLGLTMGGAFTLTFSPCIMIYPLCIQRLRTRAASLCLAGESLGCILVPPLMTVLIDRFSVRGALLVTAGLFAHLLILSVALPTRVVRRCEGGEVVVHPPSRPGHAAKRRRAVLEENPPLSMLFTVFFCAALLFVNFAYFSFGTAYPLLSNQSGVSTPTIAWAMTAQGVTELATRTAYAVSGDRLRPFQQTVAFSFSCLCMGAAAILVSVRPGDTVALFGAVCLFGHGGGGVGSLWTVLMTHLVGLPNYPVVVSFSLMGMGMFTFVMFSCMGFIVKAVGSFEWVLRIGGMGVVAAAFIDGLLVSPALFRAGRTAMEVEVKPEGELDRDCNGNEVETMLKKSDC